MKLKQGNNLMKVISRNENEGLVIGEDIHVTVLEIHQDHVLLAFECPRMTPSYWEQYLFLEADESDLELELASEYR